MLIRFFTIALALECCITTVAFGDEYSEKIQPLLQEYCYDCHGDGADEGEMQLDEPSGLADNFADRDKWLAVWKNLRAATMPPPDMEQPTATQRQVIARWIQSEVFHLDPKKPDPGRVTVRRLNRQEYENTIRDLFGVDCDSEEFPADDTGYGFDTVGDALTLSPWLLEKYLASAEKIVEQVIVSSEPRIPTITMEPWRFKGESVNSYGMPFRKPAQIDAEQAIEHAGQYKITVAFRISGSDEATIDAAELVLHVNGKKQSGKALGWDYRKEITMSAEVELDAADCQLSLQLVPGQPPKADERPLELNLHRVELHGPLDGRHKVIPKQYFDIFLDGPPTKSRKQRQAYATKIVRHFANRAFRRPVSKAYLRRLVKLADVNGKSADFEQGIARALQAILSSPMFVYRAELQPNPDDPRAIVALDDFALASRLSYFLWSSVPDQELFKVASKQQLRNDLRKQVDRMIDDWKFERFTSNFVGQWLQTRDVYAVGVNPRAILGDRADELFDGDVPWLLRRETELFFQHVLQKDRPLQELLTADYTFLNRKLAKFYGIDGISSHELEVAKLPEDSRRGGLLTHGSILLVTSNPTRTSPVKRGLFVLENLLGTPAPPAPADVPDLEEAKEQLGENATMRDHMELHRKKPLCAACHARMDPIGLAMENFNAVGRWRDTENGEPIDAAGELMTGENFGNILELQEVIATERRRDFMRCLTEKLMTYALGRGLEYYDMPTVDQIVDQAESEGGTARQLIYAIVESAAFQKRRGDGKWRRKKDNEG